MHGREKLCMQCLVGNLGERDRLKDKGVDERLILNWMFRKWDMGLELD